MTKTSASSSSSSLHSPQLGIERDDAIGHISSVDGRYASLTAELREIVSEQALMKYRLKIQALWLRYQLNHPELSACHPQTEKTKHNSAIMACLEELATENISPAIYAHIKHLEQTTRHDVKAVEYALRHILKQLDASDACLALIHFGCTSEDINNLAYGLMTQDARTIILRDMDLVIKHLSHLANQYRAQPMLSRTHGQPASPTTMGKEIAVFVHRLHRQRQHLKNQTIFGKWAGSVGNYNAHHLCWPQIHWPDIAEDFISSLGLTHNPVVTQIEPHDSFSEYCDILRRFDAIAIDLCRDIWSYISIQYFHQKITPSETGSSVMPHKVNPIHFENAEGNFGIARSLANHFSDKLLISRWQRDLSDSTVMRAFGTMVGHHQIAMKNLLSGLEKISLNPQTTDQDLDSCWEVLTEPLQTMMRAHGIADSYEYIKELTRGKSLTEQSYKAIVHKIEGLPESAKARLLALRPRDYLGLAPHLSTTPLS